MRKTLLAALALLAISAPSYAQQASKDQNQLVGTWKVVSVKATSGDKTTFPLGERPGGFVGITPDRAWFMLVDTTRPKPAAVALTDAEAVALMKSHAAFTGKYATTDAPEGIKTTIHVDAATNQAIDGTDRVYFIKTGSGKLSMKTPPQVLIVTGETSVIELEFVKAD